MTDINAPLKLKTELREDLETVQLERYVPVGGHDVRRRAKMPTINNEIDPELACKGYDEFLDVCSANRLCLTQGVQKFEFWRQCLQGNARTHWDAIMTQIGGTNTNVDFENCVVEWFTKYMEPTAFHDQKQYFLSATKAYNMNVKTTASCVLTRMKFMLYMPGAPATAAEIYTDTEKKMTLYLLMLPQWRSKFDASGNEITEDDYTWERLVKWMASQERNEQNTRRANAAAQGRPWQWTRRTRFCSWRMWSWWI